MKRILMVLFSLMVSAITFSQNAFYFNKISETEMILNYSGGINTVEGYLQDFIKAYGIDTLHTVLKKIGNPIEFGSIKEFKKSIVDKKLLDKIGDFEWMLSNKLCFLSNSIIYVLTYEPVNLGVKTVKVFGNMDWNPKSGDEENIQIHSKNLYLYRRDDNGWEKASELIRVDSCYEGEKVREFIPTTIHRNDSQPVFFAEDRGFGSVFRTSSGSVFITFETEIWNRKEHYTYNSLLVLVPKGDETYNFSYFEPKNKEYKFIKDFKARKIVLEKNGYTHVLTDGKDTFVYKTTDIGLPVLYGVYKTEYLETPDGLTIKYWDALKSNPEYWDGTESRPYVAGTLNFKIVNGQVTYNGTIELNQMR